MKLLRALGALFALFFMPSRYERMAEAHGDTDSLKHRGVFLEQWRNAAAWTSFGAAIAVCILFVFGRLRLGAIDPLKLTVAVSTWLQALATWFALANATDTWDREERLDTELRSLHFKALFFPGLALQLAIGAW